MITITTQEEFDALPLEIVGAIDIVGDQVDVINRAFPDALIFVTPGSRVRLIGPKGDVFLIQGAITYKIAGKVAYIIDSEVDLITKKSKVQNILGKSYIRLVSRSAEIGNVSGEAVIKLLMGKTHISNVFGRAKIIAAGSSLISLATGDCKINLSEWATLERKEGNASVLLSENAAILTDLFKK